MNSINNHSKPKAIPPWLSPKTLLTAATGIVLVGTPIVIDLQTPRVISISFTDVSQSNQENKTSVAEVCQTTIEHLKEGDIRIDGKFADKIAILNNQAYQERDRLSLEKQCHNHNAASPSPGIGKESGTPLPIESLKAETQKQRTLGNRDRAVAIVTIQAAEPKLNQSPLNLANLKTQVQDFVKDGNVLVFIGSNPDLEQELKGTLTDVENTNICSYSDSKSCIEWAFQTARNKH